MAERPLIHIDQVSPKMQSFVEELDLAIESGHLMANTKHGRREVTVTTFSSAPGLGYKIGKKVYGVVINSLEPALLPTRHDPQLPYDHDNQDKPHKSYSRTRVHEHLTK